MNTQLVEIQPRELKFMFELKKQSSVSVHLANVTDQYVAFKVKTTSPKKYCVRPNVGIIKPKSTYDFTVTMQAQKAAPSEMQCKDKFLIQSSVVPHGTTEDEITPGMFSKESFKYIEETKLRVLLIRAPNSPAKPQVDVVSKQEASYETFMPKESHSPVTLPVDRFNKQEPSLETKVHKDNMQNGVENPLPGPQTQPVEPVKIVKSVEESQSLKVMDDNKQSVPAKKVYPERDDNAKQVRDLEEANLKLKKDIEDLRSKISFMNSNLVEAKHTIEKLKEKNNTICEKETLKQDLAKNTIEKLKEEKSNTIREKETLKQDLGMSRRSSTQKIQVGFPPLFVCMVAIISLMIGSYFGV